MPLEQIEYDLTFQGDFNTFRTKLLKLFHKDSKSLLVPLEQIEYDLTFQDNLNIFRTISPRLEITSVQLKQIEYDLTFQGDLNTFSTILTTILGDFAVRLYQFLYDLTFSK